jgi:hypothetical protein
MNGSSFNHVPRVMSMHQLALRAAVSRSQITALMLRGQLQPFAIQLGGDGREQFLFAENTLATVTTLAGSKVQHSRHPLL